MSDKKPHSYWTKDRCKDIALKYDAKSRFKAANVGAYQAARRNKWLEEITSHMNAGKNYDGYWTKDRCKTEALKFKTRTDFSVYSVSASSISYRNGWIDEVCSHMEIQGNSFKRGLYAFEFEDNSVYIGLTFNYKERYLNHKNRSKWYKEKLGIKYIFKTYDIFYPKEMAGKKEIQLIEEYAQKGWTILNKVKGGNLGGSILVWTYEECKKDSLKYDFISEWNKKSPGAYNSARRNGWIKEFTKHMTIFSKPKGYWTKERCKEEALKYITRTSWCRNSPSSYGTASKYGWLKECCEHMSKIRRTDIYWTYEMCKQDAGLFCKRSDWKKQSASAYASACKNGWLKECCEHMEPSKSVKKQVICLENNKIFTSASEAAKEIGAHVSSIKSVCRGKTNKIHGFSFKYLDKQQAVC